MIKLYHVFFNYYEIYRRKKTQIKESRLKIYARQKMTLKIEIITSTYVSKVKIDVFRVTGKFHITTQISSYTIPTFMYIFVQARFFSYKGLE